MRLLALSRNVLVGKPHVTVFLGARQLAVIVEVELNMPTPYGPYSGRHEEAPQKDRRFVRELPCHASAPAGSVDAAANRSASRAAVSTSDTRCCADVMNPVIRSISAWSKSRLSALSSVRSSFTIST